MQVFSNNESWEQAQGIREFVGRLPPEKDLLYSSMYMEVSQNRDP